MKFPWTLVAVTALCFVTALKQTHALNSSLTAPLTEEAIMAAGGASEEVIKQRIAQLDLPVNVRYNSEIGELIKRYVVIGSKEAEGMLGRTSMYFPIFEHYLRVYQLPEELKYLPMVESTLRPEVRSVAGAAGLWQFVPTSGRHFGLQMDNVVDERMDPYRSTEAAVKLLSELYKTFGDWSLVLVAFNAGSGRVQKAIRSAKSKDYWQVSKFLPRESRKYLPAFIAAGYLVNYYGSHGLKPKYPSYELQETRTFRVYTNITFNEIAQACALKLSVIQALNPSYLQRFVPANKEGNFIVLPASATNSFRQYLSKKIGAQAKLETPSGTFKTSYLVVPGDKIETVAMLLKCDVKDLMKWNNLAHREVVVNQHLVLFLPNSQKVKP